MSLTELLAELARRSISLGSVEGSLSVEGPPVDLPEELVSSLKAHRDELLSRIELLSGAPETDRKLPDLVVRPDERFDPFPLTDIQQAYWVGRRDEIDFGSAIHVYVEVESTDLDIARLETAWNRLVDRHEMLRAVVDDQGRQRVLGSVPSYAIEVDDLSGISLAEATTNLASHRSRMESQKLPLDSWPLFEIRAAVLPGGKLRLFIDLDCTLVDSWSVQILFRELTELYGDPEASLEPAQLGMSYRDYVNTVVESRDSAVHRASVEYWSRRLQTLPPAPELPLRSSGSTRGVGFRRRAERVDPDGYSRLVDNAAKHNITPMSLMLAAYAEVIGTWALRPRFTLNVPLYNRLPLHPDVSHTVGTFSSFTLLEVDMGSGSSFAQRAAAVHARMMADLEHTSGGGVRLMRELMRRDGSISAGAMPVVFTSFAGGVDGIESFWIDDLGSRLGEIVHSVTQTPQVWIDHQVLVQHGGLYLNWDFADELFPTGLVDTMFEAYVDLLHRLTDDVWWDAPDPVPTAEGTVSGGDGGSAEQERSGRAASIGDGRSGWAVHGGFVEHASSNPEATAVVAPDRTLTYGQLLQRATRFARKVASFDPKPGLPVAVVLPSGWHQAVAAIGALMAGTSYMPLDPDLPLETVGRLAERAGAMAVVAPDEGGEALAALTGLPVICAGEIEGEDLVQIESTATPLLLTGVPDPQLPACVVHTSGTTGLPNGAVLSHRGISHAIACTNERFSVGGTDRTLAVTPVNHDMALYDLFGILDAGGSVVYPEPARRRDPSHWVELIVDHSVSIWNSVPAMMEMLLDHLGGGKRAGLSLRLAFLGGDWISPGLPGRARATIPGMGLVSVGGPTETTLWNIWYPIGEVDPAWSSIPYGEPIPATRYFVMDENLRERPVWAAGELCCTGPGLAVGYLADAETVAERFVSHPGSGEPLYRTGDLGRRRPDGLLEILGRVDFQFKINGRRIDPREIESVISGVDGVDSAVVVPTGSSMTAFFRLTSRPGDGDLSAGTASVGGSDIADRLRSTLPAHLIPNRWHRLEMFPLTANGKVDRKALIRQASMSAAGEPENAPSSMATGSGSAPGGLRDALCAMVSGILDVREVDAHQRFFDVGATSVHLVRLHAAIRDGLGLDIAVTDLFEHTDIASLAGHIESRSRTTKAGPWSRPDDPETLLSSRHDHPEARTSEPVAIIGMACRFPGASDIAAFWQNLVEGHESVTFFSDADLLAAGIDPSYARASDRVAAGAVLESIDGFDAELFGFSAREAEITDPQNRIFMECCWEALERAGYVPGDPTVSIGVFAGKSMSNYVYPHLDLTDPINYFQALFGNDKSFIATQTSFKLDLTGPSVSIDTACSTSIVTLDAACTAVRAGKCDIAISGGSSLKIPQAAVYDGSPDAGMFSADGHTRAFDARASGLVPGSGAGAVVLKRLDRAIADGDHVHAIVRGISVNNDGAGKVGFSAPSVTGQRRCIEGAYRSAGIEPDSIAYVEAHGTGTPMGDPIEVAALKQAFGNVKGRARCALGSVKSNIGHLDTAAGVAGVIKAVLALENELIPPSINFSEPNPSIDFEDSPFFVASEPLAWVRDASPRRCGVSSFGVGGTNAHAILEESPEPLPRIAREPLSAVEIGAAPFALPISALSEEALAEYGAAYARFVKEGRCADLHDLAFTAQVGRRTLPERAVVVASDADTLAVGCSALAAGVEDRSLVRGRTIGGRPPTIAFLFPGHGSQFSGMGKVLYATETVFREHIDLCHSVLRDRYGIELAPIIVCEDESEPLLDIVGAQVGLFAVSTGLAALWATRGVRPDAVLGHSVGEFAAAHVCGILSLEDGLALVAERIRLIEQHGLSGRTVLAMCPEDVARAAVARSEGTVTIGSYNSPESFVLSGSSESVARLVGDLAEMGVETKDLHAPRAAHSPLMEPVVRHLVAFASDLDFSSPSIPLVANLSGRVLESGEFGADYVGRQLLEPVRLGEGFASLAALGCDTFVEVGPRAALSVIGQQNLSGGDIEWVGGLRPGSDGRTELLTSLSRLYVRGTEIDWRPLHLPGERRRIPAPTYPFQRSSYWSRDTVQALGGGARSAIAGGGSTTTGSDRLLGHRQFSPAFPEGELHFESRVIGSAGEPEWCRQHGALGSHILPASAYLDLGLAAARHLADGPVSVHEMVIHDPMILPNEAEAIIHVTLEPEISDSGGSLREFRVHSARVPDAGVPPRWTLHAEGSVGPSARVGRVPAAIRIQDVRSRIDGAEHRARAADHGAQFGELFGGLSELRVARGGSDAEVVAPPGAVREFGDYAFHPAVLDSCLQAVVASVEEVLPGHLLIPASIGRCTLVGEPDRRLSVFVRNQEPTPGGGSRADVVVCDSGGGVVAEVEDLRLVPARAVDIFAADPPTPDGLIMRVVWEPDGEVGRRPGSEDGASRHAAGLREVAVVTRDASTAEVAQVRLGLAAHYDEVEVTDDAATPLEGDVVYLAGSYSGPVDVEDELWLLAGVVNSLVEVAERAVGSARDGGPRLTVATFSAFRTREGETSCPVGAAVAAFAAAAAVEHPELDIRVVDLDTEALSSPDTWAVSSGVAAGRQVAVRRGELLSRALRPVEDESAGEGVIDPDAVYLITGGTGRLGVLTAAALADRGARHVALLARSAEAAEARARVASLTARGVEVELIGADVADQGALRLAIGRLTATRRLRGVFHLAGFTIPKLVTDIDHDDITGLCAAKIAGAVNLEEVTRGLDLDHFVLFSSIAAEVAIPGQSVYAAANAALRALAERRAAQGLNSLCIQWGPWSYPAAGSAYRAEAQMRDQGIGLLPDHLGIAVLDAMVRSALAGPVVSVVRATGVSAPGGRGSLAAARVSDPDRRADPGRAGRSELRDELAAGSREEAIRVLETLVRENLASLLGLVDARSIPSDAGFATLGLDSMGGVELRNRTQAAIGLRLPATVVFRNPTVGEFSSHLASLLRGEGG